MGDKSNRTQNLEEGLETCDYDSAIKMYDYPFLSDSKTFNYVSQMAKILVLVQDTPEVLSLIAYKYLDNAVVIKDDSTADNNEKELCKNEVDQYESIHRFKEAFHVHKYGDEHGDKDENIQRFKKTFIACENGKNVVAVEMNDPEELLDQYFLLALEFNYIVIFIKPRSMFPDIFPIYMGWHLDKQNSDNLSTFGHFVLEKCLTEVQEFCRDFESFSHCNTISEMTKFYILAQSNYNGMLHCTAKYLRSEDSQSKERYLDMVNGEISQCYDTSCIGFVFTPRTFGGRVKLTPEQLTLWGGDTDNKAGISVEEINNLSSDLTTVLSAENEHGSPEEENALLCFNDSVPDFHPVTGIGKRAHMTLGVAPGESAVTTGTDLLQIVECEAKEQEWPTYELKQGWLRCYGESRWVFYLKETTSYPSLFAGVYKVLE